ncbi:hypothetical protein SEPCBS57363_001910 [Sporothrix epigloea]|uniref:Transmembrane protein n=1 Tax=Sporothrix epigloea TaxID=1892477 RepID=A0ABP0DGT7_9PEZI
MQPLFAVHNNVSLLSITIAPSTFLAALTLIIVFFSLSLPRLPSIPRLFSFGRSKSNTGDKEVVLRNHQQRITEDLGNDDSHSLDVRYWRNKEDLNIDWRHRQLPPLPPPPFRSLLGERSYVEAELHKREESADYLCRKAGGRFDRERSYRKDIREVKEIKERRREDEKAARRPRLDRKIGKPSTSYKEKRHSRSTTVIPTVLSSDLVPYSGGCREEIESINDSDSAGGYSPPAWRRLENGDRSSGFWRKCDNILGSPSWAPPTDLPRQQHLPTKSSVPSYVFTSYFQQQAQRRENFDEANQMFVSRSSSPGFDSGEDALVDELLGPEEDDDFEIHPVDRVQVNDILLERAMRTRLPGSMSPDKERSPEPEQVYSSPASRIEGMRLKAMASIQEEPTAMMGEKSLCQDSPANDLQQAVHSKANNGTFCKLRSAPVRGWLQFSTRSWAPIVIAITIAIMSAAAIRGITYSAISRPVPDLVKIAGVARSFAPLIHYSEIAVVQVHDLEASGVAVWDLGESVRLSNLTSAPIIVQELDELSDTLRTLAMELTRFFANIDGDIDGILIVMEWARRELSQLQHPPASLSAAVLLIKPLTAVYDNVYSILAYAGLLENATGSPTAVGTVATALFGMSGTQLTHATLHRTFNEFLGVLEEAVTTELHHSLALFALFEKIDRQFQNLVRTVAREAQVQDERHADLLAGLWTRIVGPNAAATAKYEYNSGLLRDLRDKTVRDKRALIEHNHRLLALKTNLESLRRKLVSPLMRSVSSSTLTLDEQIQGLEIAGEFLAEARLRQKGKLLEAW